MIVAVVDRKTMKSTFPKLMERRTDKLIILFVNATQGTVVDSGGSSYEIGTYWTGDSQFYDEFGGVVSLSNREL